MFLICRIHIKKNAVLTNLTLKNETVISILNSVLLKTQAPLSFFHFVIIVGQVYRVKLIFF